MEYNVLDQVQTYLLDSNSENRQKGVRLIITSTENLFRDVPFEKACSKLLVEKNAIEESFLNAPTAAQRRCGVVALRSMVKGLPAKLYPEKFVQLFSTPIFDSFRDNDPTVRAAAAEATYELLRKLNTQVLQSVFQELFIALSFAINDKDCRTSLLAREISSMMREPLGGDDSFRLDLEMFVQLVCRILEPYGSAPVSPGLRISTDAHEDSLVVQWILEWIDYILDMPGHDLVDYLPSLLSILITLPMRTTEGVLWKLLQTCRSEFKKSIRSGGSSTHSACTILRVLLSTIYTMEYPLTKRLCLEWVGDFVDLGNQSSASESLKALYADMLLSALRHVGSADNQLQEAAQRLNSELMSALIQIEPKTSRELLTKILVMVTDLLGVEKGCAERHLAALQWVTLLHHKDVELVESCLGDVIKGILALLSDASTEIYTKAIEALCLITKGKHLHSVLEGIFSAVRQTPSVLFPRLATILKQMQICLEMSDTPTDQCETLMIAICETLPLIPDKRFVCKCVITLNHVLLTSAEFSQLRQLLKQGVASSERVRTNFAQLSRAWNHNGVALLGLCLLTQSYGLSLAICQYLAQIELSSSTLVQLDHLAQMLEGPVFSFLRAALLTPSRCVPLIQTLFGILLLLPQITPQYEILYNRLKVVPSLAQLEQEESKAITQENLSTSEENLWLHLYQPLLQDFKKRQEEIVIFEQTVDL